MAPITNSHFLRLARRGARPGASSGENAAYRLADVATRYAADLDDQALEGFLLFVEQAKQYPSSAVDVLAEIET